MRQRFITLVSILVTLALTACGGGGEAEEEYTVASSSAPPILSETPGPVRDPAPAMPVIHIGSTLSNELPENGSNSAIGNGVEGLWMAPSGPSSGFGFIDTQGHYLGFVAVAGGAVYPEVFEGGVALAGTSWSFTSVSQWSISDGISGYSRPLYGSGSVMLRRQFQGTYVRGQLGGTVSSLAYVYSTANALAASQSDVSGDWSTAEVFLSIDSQGVLTGNTHGENLGECVLRGTVMHMEPTTRKNMYAVSLTASPRAIDDTLPLEPVSAPASSKCLIDTRLQPLSGYTAISREYIFDMAKPTNKSSLTLLVKNGTRSLVGEFDKDIRNALLR